MTLHSRILVVDDDRHVRDVMELILKAGQFRDIVTVPSADEAFELLDIAHDDAGLHPLFDLILLDIRMPGADGIEACARIRNTRRYRDTPILIISAATETEALNQVFIAGAHDFLPKPINRIEFLARIRAALRFKRELDRRRGIETRLMHINRSLQEGQDALSPANSGGSAGPRAFSARLQDAAEAGIACGMIGAWIRAPELAESEMAGRLALLDAPINWTLAAYGEGRYFVLAPGANTDRLDVFAQVLSTLAEQTAALHEAETGKPCKLDIETVTSAGRGLELLALPSELTTIMERNLSLRDEATLATESTS